MQVVSSITMTAPDAVDDRRFVWWVIDAQPQNIGRRTVTIDASDDVSAEAVYAIPRPSAPCGVFGLPADVQADTLNFTDFETTGFRAELTKIVGEKQVLTYGADLKEIGFRLGATLILSAAYFAVGVVVFQRRQM